MSLVTMRKLGAAACLAAVVTALSSCSPEKLVGNAPLPPDVPDPAQTHTPAGALAAYRGALLLFRTAVGGDANSMIPISGLLTDELRSGDLGQIGNVSSQMLIDSRFMKEFGGSGEDNTTAGEIRAVYGFLQKARGQSRESRGALAAFIPTGSNELQGHLDAIEGYSEVYLADLFCSGVPLSTLDYGRDFTYKAGSTTVDVYKNAISLFDSALTLAADSDRILNFARVGKARALLDMGNYADADAAVADVPDDFQYVLLYDQSASPGSLNSTVNQSFASRDFSLFGVGMLVTMVDQEGGDGLPFLSSGDPRTSWVDNGVNQFGRELVYPVKYSIDGGGPIVIASGSEARLIQAEARLQANDGSWLTILNALRTDGSFDTQQDPNDDTKTDTLWHAGSGGIAGLAPLSDPGTPDARLNLVFQERGYWLFLTGTRQGDLRRLIREYGRQPSQVYPTGLYPGAYNTYGSDVTAPIPGEERISNPLFTGCQGRGA
jgi:starch-binding outer membrane protein, SusD/RagB family